ncbi:MAG: hypothetical protein AAF788_02565 [Pseudomonadota bacterium]
MSDETASAPAPQDTKRTQAAVKARRLVLWTVGILFAVIVAFVLLSSSSFLEFRLSVLLKLGAGVVGTIILAAGLMAASFYSDDSGFDDDQPAA